MSPRPFLLILLTAIIFSAVQGFGKVTIRLDGNTTTDLSAYLDDLRTATASAEYTATLSARLLRELQVKLEREEVDCACDQVVKESTTYKLHEELRAWNDARKVCREQGGRLPIVRNEKDVQKLTAMLEKSNTRITAAFIGAHSLFGKDDWVDILGEPFAKTEFVNFTQSGDALESCGVISSSGTVTSRDCEIPRAYFCEVRR